MLNTPGIHYIENLQKHNPEALNDYPALFNDLCRQHSPLADHEWLLLVMTLVDAISRREVLPVSHLDN